MATKRKRGNSIEYVIKCSKLLDSPISMTFRDEAEGDFCVARMEASLAQGVVPDDLLNIIRQKKGIDLNAHLREYLNSQAVSIQDREILNLYDFSNLQATKLHVDWAWGVIRSLKEKRRAPVTIRHHVGALSRYLSYLHNCSVIPDNPFLRVGKNYSTYADRSVEDGYRDRRLDWEEEQRIIDTLTGRYVRPRSKPLKLKHRRAYLLLFTLALETAMRLGELVSIEKSQIDWNERCILLNRTKNGSKRLVPLSTVAFDALQNWKNPGRYVFPFYNGCRKTSSTNCSGIWRQITDYAGIENLRFHDLRHEAVSRLYERTSLETVEITSITGHKSIAALKRYMHLRGSYLAERLW